MKYIVLYDTVLLLIGPHGPEKQKGFFLSGLSKAFRRVAATASSNHHGVTPSCNFPAKFMCGRLAQVIIYPKACFDP